MAGSPRTARPLARPYGGTSVSEDARRARSSAPRQRSDQQSAKESARALSTLPHAARSAAPFGPALDHLSPALGSRRSLPRPVPDGRPQGRAQQIHRRAEAATLPHPPALGAVMPILANPKHEIFPQGLAQGCGPLTCKPDTRLPIAPRAICQEMSRSRSRVDELVSASAAKAGVTGDRIVAELAKIAFSDIRRLLRRSPFPALKRRPMGAASGPSELRSRRQRAPASSSAESFNQKGGESRDASDESSTFAHGISVLI
jgi:hypothetical protein